MKIYRNKDGDLYFRQPMDSRTRNEDSVVTWHIDLNGEALLQKEGVGEGDDLPFDLFLELRDFGYLYVMDEGRGRGRGKKQKTPHSRFDWTATVGFKAERPGTTQKSVTGSKATKQVTTGQPAPKLPAGSTDSGSRPAERQQTQSPKKRSKKKAAEQGIQRKFDVTSDGVVRTVWTVPKRGKE